MSTAQSRHRELGLTDFEFDLIVEKLGREPNGVELAVFSLMWSEHCGYKHSRRLLGRLPTDSPRMVMGPGENAGAVSVGDGSVACAFKVESHNHPSAVEPFQGAATGVGGILRDIFAIGARPIALLDSLRFGELEDSARSRYLLEHAVAGIGHYGNSIGVPTVGGEIYFEGSYEQNCLINVMCVGLVDTDRMIRSAAAGVGNVVVLFGARTGRDGIGGASVLASAELGADDDGAKRPTVQIGDPFEENKVMHCSLDLLERGSLVALQDLGAAGLTSSASEMASKGEVGIDIDVRRVPLREADMEPFEIMISESQERMLAVVEPDRLDEVLAVCARWEVHGTAIGEVTDTRTLRVFDDGEQVGEMPVTALVDECPAYDLEPAPPERPLYPAPPRRLPEGLDQGGTLLALLGSANLASRRWVFEQYDHLVGSRTVRRPADADAAVLLLQAGPATSGQRTALAMSIDGNGRRVACDPYRGAVEAVLECSANLACVGAEPVGLTNCLNFGNPEKPHIAWQLTNAVDGIADACRALDVPVVGGNVSLYNEGAEGPVLPTPVIGMVGELRDAARAGRLAWRAEGDVVAIVAAPSWAPSLAGSELAKLRGEAPSGPLPAADPAELRRVHAAIRDGVASGALASAHDVAEGGLAAALADCCVASGLGARVQLTTRADAESLLFGEGPGAFVVSGSEEGVRSIGPLAEIVGTVGGSTLRVRGAEVDLTVRVDALGLEHDEALPRLLR
ncbi:MAG: Phosphoribosylformylglycinamidine synthase, synthetase subunit [uncultured Solirubrobacteraceae bacterium]|uniref:Phosphoribosylformylglycinamidine synthase subunit PurL n=1 Tax=uncultured Solirubrobacteraceae bacterium TaxID=1162706 RepID=A0A6J4R1C8_9ACTN|nr:MAG: Phosphoribosylformylglycinamidine synthase, synthetase subunit [uncultured Solirubrobacteraceae bacterium]